MACTLAESPCDPFHRKLRQLRCLRCRFDCYRVERTSSRAGVTPAEVQAPFTAHVESRTGAVALASRWLVGWAFASPPQSGLAWLCFLFPLIEPDRRSYRIRLSEKTHGVTCDAVGNF